MTVKPNNECVENSVLDVVVVVEEAKLPDIYIVTSVHVWKVFLLFGVMQVLVWK
jgi:hypothetical protein